MTLHAPAYIQGNNYPAEDDRHAVFATHGVGVVDGLVVTQRAAGANTTVDVSAGHAVLPVESGKTGVWSDAVVSVQHGAAPPADSRIDVVYALVTGSGWVVDVVKGAAAVAPVAPTVPVNALPLAQVTRASGTSAILNTMITNVSRLSTPLALTQWPVVDAATVPDAGVLSEATVSWGSLGLPAPHRPVKVVATMTMQVQFLTNSNFNGYVRLRCTHGSTVVDGPEWIVSPYIQPNVAGEATFTVSEMFDIDPTGAVTISSRIRNQSDNIRFQAGRIIATMYPR